MPKTTVDSKFYTFGQNNSGGQFTFEKTEDNTYTVWVIIEAVNAAHANTIAENNGLYFDGCYKNMDCSCCGDRWYTCDESDGREHPSIYGQSIEDYKNSDSYYQWLKNGDPEFVVIYLDGRKEWS